MMEEGFIIIQIYKLGFVELLFDSIMTCRRRNRCRPEFHHWLGIEVGSRFTSIYITMRTMATETIKLIINCCGNNDDAAGSREKRLKM
jgi:hypothetical protein